MFIRLHKLLFALLCLALMLWQQPQANAYVSPAGYRFTPPAGWQKVSSPSPNSMGYRATAPRMRGATLIVSVAENPPTDDIVSGSQAIAKVYTSEFPNCKVVSQEYGTLAGEKALRLHVVFPMGRSARPFDGVQLFAIRNHKMYVITFIAPVAAYDAVLPAYGKAIRSFGFTR